jgi:hypothetical protein
MVRLFSDNLIHVSLYNPPVNRRFNTKEEAFSFLRNLTS